MIDLMQRLLATCFAVLLLVCVVIVLVTGTRPGTRWLLETAGNLAGETLSIDNPRGTLLDGLRADRVQVLAGLTTVVVDEVELRLFWPDLLRRRLTLRAPAAARVTVTLAPDPAADPDSPAGEPLRLPVAIQADDLRFGALAIVTPDGGADLAGLRFSGRLTRRGTIEFRELAAALHGVVAEASGRFGTGRPWDLQAAVVWELPAADIRGSGTANGSLADGLALVQRVLLPGGEAAGAVLAEATVRVMDQPLSFTARARWTRIEQALPGLGRLRSEAGELELRGDITAWEGRLVTALEAVGQGHRGSLGLEARGDLARAELTNVRLLALGGALTGTATLRFADGLQGEFSVDAAAIDPHLLDPRLSGRLGARAAGTFAGDGSFRLQVEELRGELAGRPVLASGLLARREATLWFENVDVAVGANRLQVAGSLGERLAGRFTLDAPETAVLLPELSGALRGSGTLGGTLAAPEAQVELRGEDVGLGGFATEVLGLRGALGGGGSLEVVMTAGSMRYAGRYLGNLEAAVSGSLAAHATRLEIAGGQVGVALGANGSWREGGMRQELNEGMVVLPGPLAWVLRDTVLITAGPAGFGVTTHCWQADDASLCVADTRFEGSRLETGLVLTGVPLGSLAPLLVGGLTMGGTLDGELSLQRGAGTLRGFLGLEARSASLSFRTAGGDEFSDRFETLRLRVDAADDEIRYGAELQDSFGIALVADGRVLDPLGPEPRIRGKLTGGIPDLGSFSPVLEEFVDIADVAGRVDLEVELGGRLSSPDLQGGLDLSGGMLTVPAAGITVRDIVLAIEGRPDGTATVRGEATSGAGQVAIGGDLRWQDQLLPEAVFTLRGEAFELVRLPEGTVQVSPDIRIDLRDRQFRVSGQLLVPAASITLREIAGSAVEVSPDVVVHGRETAPPAGAPVLFVLDRVEVVLGPDVRFAGFGLSAGLTGRLTLSQNLEAVPGPVSGDGVIQVRDGRFQGLGQQLGIDRGALIFAGDLTDPVLDVRASRLITWEGREVRAGLLVTGNVSRLQTRVFSEPAMGELDALSYLTTGRPLSAAGAGDRLSVSNAAISLGLQGALPVARKLGSALGVEEVGLAGGGELEDTELVIGDRIGQDLYLRYSYGIFNRIVTISATYRLSRRFSIEASSGEWQSLYLLYSINW